VRSAATSWHTGEAGLAADDVGAAELWVGDADAPPPGEVVLEPQAADSSPAAIVTTTIRHRCGGPFDISLPPSSDRPALARNCHNLGARRTAHHPARG
jgi:hypothetical protein